MLQVPLTEVPEVVGPGSLQLLIVVGVQVAGRVVKEPVAEVLTFPALSFATA